MKRPLQPFFVACVLLGACGPTRDETSADASASGPAEESDVVVVRFGLPAKPDPRETYTGTQPLLDYLSEETPYAIESRVGRSVELVEVPPAVQDLVTYLEERLAEIAPLGALSYCVADMRFGALPLVTPLGASGEAREHSVFIAPRGGRVTELGDLADVAGRRLALGPTHSALGSLVPRHELATAGISPALVHFESDRAVLEAVLRGDVDAGVVASWFWDVAASDSVETIHVSPPIPSRPLVVREDLPLAVREILMSALVRSSETPETARENWDPTFRYGFAPSAREDFARVCALVTSQRASCAAGCHE